jgi:repressor LexA
MKTVTPRQLEILRFIRDFRTTNGYSPTMQEIGDHLELTKVTVFEHVGALEKKGLLLRGEKHKARSLQVSEQFQFPDEQKSTRIPMLGHIAAGSPIEAIENREFLDLEDLFPADTNTFVLKVRGDSMIDDQIADGDYVVCQRRNSARDGEMVVALLEDGEATLKRIFREAGRVRLQPANANYDPIYAEHVDIQGVVIGMIRLV